MAGPTEPDKIAILAEIAAARTRLSETGKALRHVLDVPSRTRESFKHHRPAWLGGAAMLGLVLSKLPVRKKTVFVERSTGKALGTAGKLGILWSTARLAFDFAKPLISEMAGKHLGELARRFRRAGQEQDGTAGSDTP